MAYPECYMGRTRIVSIFFSSSGLSYVCYSQLKILCNLNYRSHNFMFNHSNHNILFILLLQPVLKILLLLLGRFFSQIVEILIEKSNLGLDMQLVGYQLLAIVQETTDKCFFREITHHFPFKLVQHGWNLLLIGFKCLLLQV